MSALSHSIQRNDEINPTTIEEHNWLSGPINAMCIMTEHFPWIYLTIVFLGSLNYVSLWLVMSTTLV